MGVWQCVTSKESKAKIINTSPQARYKTTCRTEEEEDAVYSDDDIVVEDSRSTAHSVTSGVRSGSESGSDAGSGSESESESRRPDSPIVIEDSEDELGSYGHLMYL